MVFSGLVKVEQAGEQTGVLVAGDGFGELSLLYPARHDATVSSGCDQDLDRG